VELGGASQRLAGAGVAAFSRMVHEQHRGFEVALQAAQHLPSSVPPGSGYFFAEDDLDRLSNRVVDLIDDGRLEEAEAACQELKEQYPEVIDWIHRTAMLHEARGETPQAIEFYERTLQFMDAYPEDFEELSREPFREAIERLQRPPDAPS
jgi:tetratricopeptide (TPR) repeat protein